MASYKYSVGHFRDVSKCICTTKAHRAVWGFSTSTRYVQTLRDTRCSHEDIVFPPICGGENTQNTKWMILTVLKSSYRTVPINKKDRKSVNSERSKKSIWFFIFSMQLSTCLSFSHIKDIALLQYDFYFFDFVWTNYRENCSLFSIPIFQIVRFFFIFHIRNPLDQLLLKRIITAIQNPLRLNQKACILSYNMSLDSFNSVRLNFEYSHAQLWF